jgi:hypothetical protein
MARLQRRPLRAVWSRPGRLECALLPACASPASSRRDRPPESGGPTHSLRSDSSAAELRATPDHEVRRERRTHLAGPRALLQARGPLPPALSRRDRRGPTSRCQCVRNAGRVYRIVGQLLSEFSLSSSTSCGFCLDCLIIRCILFMD